MSDVRYYYTDESLRSTTMASGILSAVNDLLQTSLHGGGQGTIATKLMFAFGGALVSGEYDIAVNGDRNEFTIGDLTVSAGVSIAASTLANALVAAAAAAAGIAVAAESAPVVAATIIVGTGISTLYSAFLQSDVHEWFDSILGTVDVDARLYDISDNWVGGGFYVDGLGGQTEQQAIDGLIKDMVSEGNLHLGDHSHSIKFFSGGTDSAVMTSLYEVSEGSLMFKLAALTGDTHGANDDAFLARGNNAELLHSAFSVAEGASSWLAFKDGDKITVSFDDILNKPNGGVERQFDPTAISVDGETALGFESKDTNFLFIGGSGNDWHDGGNCNDWLIGGDGNDTLYGRGGDDVLVASSKVGDGQVTKDVLSGGDGDDTLYGSDGVDALLGDSGDDVVYGEGGNDNITASAGSDTIYGGDGDDTIYVTGGSHLIFGDAGNDTVEGGGHSEIYLGAGNDTAKNILPGTLIQTGSGNDHVQVGDNVAYADLDGNDQVCLANGFQLTGGVKHGGGEDPNAQGAGGILYGYNKQHDLIVTLPNGFQTFLLDAQADPTVSSSLRPGGILVGELDTTAKRLLDPTLPVGFLKSDFDAYAQATKALAGTQHIVGGVDPLVLDLDGNGFDLTAQTLSGPRFDVDGDGFAEPTGWVLPNDGLLALDKNANGTIDDVNELFGTATQSGFSVLAAYDTDGDGAITANDAVFGDLRVWQDLNLDGISESGELSSLAALGITSISLTGNSDQAASNAGNYIAATGSFTRDDGTTGAVADVKFHIDNFNSTYLGDTTVDPAVAGMPDLKGHGTLADLHVALSNDANLQSVMTAELPNLTSYNLDTLVDEAMPILSAWAHTDTLNYPDVPLLVNVDANGSLTVVDFAVRVGSSWARASGTAILDGNGDPITDPTLADVQSSLAGESGMQVLTITGDELGFLEKYLGEEVPILDVTVGNQEAIDAMTGVYSFLLERLQIEAVRLGLQGPMGDLLPGLEYDASTDMFKPTTDAQLAPAFEAIFAAAPSGAQATLDYLAGWQDTLRVIVGNYDRGEDYLHATYSFLFTNIVEAYESVGLDADLASVATAMGIPADQLRMGTGQVDGTDGLDIFYLGACGDDTFVGGQDADAYVAGRDFGHDVIRDVEGPTGVQADDILRFANYNSDEVTMYRDGTDLVITVNGTDNEIRVEKEFEGPIPGLWGSDYSNDNGVAEIIFADGVNYNRIDIARAVSHPQAGDELYTGTAAIDFLDGGAGQDTLSGKDNGDLYAWGRGDGNDIIDDDPSNVLIDAPDYLTFKAGLTPDDIEFIRNGASEDLTIRIRDTGETLTIVDQFHTAYAGIETYNINEIEIFSFSNGLMLGSSDVMDMLLAPSNGDDYLVGFNRADTLDGGPGNDTLQGGNGSDTYLFGRGSGNDVIQDQLDNFLSGNVDVVRFGAGLTPDDLTFSGNGLNNDIKITINDTGETLIIKDQGYAYDTVLFGVDGENRIEQFQFEDGTTLNWDDVRALIFQTEATNGDDTIQGYFSQDTLEGGLGDDSLIGGGDGDTYIYNLGDGNDTIYDEMGLVLVDTPDVLQFGDGIVPDDVRLARSGNDLLLTLDTSGETVTIQKYFKADTLGDQLNLIEEIHFTDGTVWHYSDVTTRMVVGSNGDDSLVGGFFHDFLDGGPGNDTLEGGNDGDTYVYGRNYGNDRVYDQQESILYDAPDIIQFTDGLTPADFDVARVGNDLIFTVKDTGETLTVAGQYDLTQPRIEEFHFSDGTVTTAGDYMSFTHTGTDGADSLVGSPGADVFIGGLGDDTLNGGAGLNNGVDTYIYSLGDGNDLIVDLTGNNSLNDQLILHNVTPDDLHVGRSSLDAYDMTLLMPDGGQITVDQQFYPVPTGIDKISFDDGTVWTMTDITAHAIEEQETADNDTVVAFYTNDTLAGGLGDDLLSGGDGSDTYIYNSGDGHDRIDDNGAGDTDRIYIHGYAPDDLTLSVPTPGSNDLTIDFAGGTDQLTVVGTLFPNGGDQIEQVIFDDGTVWTQDDVRARLFADLAGNDDARIVGYPINDTLAGGGGNDTLSGKDGSDTYVFNPGDGQDVIQDSGYGDTDRLVVHGYSPADVTLTLANGTNDGLLLRFAGSTDTVSILNTLDGNIYDQVEQIVFDDGTIWSIPTLSVSGIDGTDQADSLTGSIYDDVISGLGGDDYLFGDAGNDTLYGGAGNDTLVGGSGWDTMDGGDGIDTISYVFGTGSTNINLVTHDGGGETITNFENVIGSQGANTITGDAGDNMLDGQGGNDHIYGGAGNDTLIGGGGWDTMDGGDGIDTISYVNGTTDFSINLVTNNGGGESITNFENVIGSQGANTITGTSGDNRLDGQAGNDSILGGDGADTLIGGAGSDMLTGGTGNDDFVFDAGWGTDTVVDFQDGLDHLDLSSSGLAYGDLSIVQQGSDVLISDANGDSILLAGIDVATIDQSDFVF